VINSPTRPILAGLRIIEISAFVAAPLAGASRAAHGADVIRVGSSRRWHRQSAAGRFLIANLRLR
jgi:crotonobetainyl-CoA:carnitine CoA-transferase CaiB-like acyl-CoA transferase